MIRAPAVGEQRCSVSKYFVSGPSRNAEGFGGSTDRAEQAARELTKREGLLRRTGDLGNTFEPVNVPSTSSGQRRSSSAKPQPSHALQPTRPSPIAGSLTQCSNTFLSVFSKVLTASSSGEPLRVRARHGAGMADGEHRIAVRSKPDRQRLGLEERSEDTLRVPQRREAGHLQAVKTVPLQFYGTFPNLPRAPEAPLECSAPHVAAYF